jgi:hypothetical protein
MESVDEYYDKLITFIMDFQKQLIHYMLSFLNKIESEGNDIQPTTISALKA